MNKAREVGRRVRSAVDHFESTSINDLKPLERKYRPISDDGDESGSASSSGCGCSFIAVGSEDGLGGTGNVSAVMVIDDIGFLGSDIELNHDTASPLVYVSDEISYSC